MQTQGSEAEKTIVKLKKHLARPPGCSFLGACATETLVSLTDPKDQQVLIIVDSGSDITLISQKALDKMVKPPKIRTGQ